MKIKNQKMINVIYQASKGNLCFEEMEEVLSDLSVKDSQEFLKLIKMLSIMHGCEELMETPENRMPI